MTRIPRPSRFTARPGIAGDPDDPGAPGRPRRPGRKATAVAGAAILVVAGGGAVALAGDDDPGGAVDSIEVGNVTAGDIGATGAGEGTGGAREVPALDELSGTVTRDDGDRDDDRDDDDRDDDDRDDDDRDDDDRDDDDRDDDGRDDDGRDDDGRDDDGRDDDGRDDDGRDDDGRDDDGRDDDGRDDDDDDRGPLPERPGPSESRDLDDVGDLKVDGIDLDFGPEEWLVTAGPIEDFDGDGQAEDLLVELDGLVGTEATFLVRMDDDDDADVYIINDLTFRDPAGPAPWRPASGPGDDDRGDDRDDDGRDDDRDDRAAAAAGEDAIRQAAAAAVGEGAEVVEFDTEDDGEVAWEAEVVDADGRRHEVLLDAAGGVVGSRRDG